ncbi:hypothetical protein OHA25_54310 [Nonomuraea sp. NBC_00507]|uniref:hypothetical protein n=1 Tax=Nonomuraea sp. NBC_00507 TaxID=2976002 RepID=UPI002E17419E
MKQSHELRWGGLAGVASILAALIGRLVMGSAPQLTEPAMTISGFLTERRVQVLAAALLYAVAAALLLWFGVALATAMRRADETSDAPALVLAGYVLLAAIGFIGISMFAGMTYAITTHPPLLAIAAGPYTVLTVMDAITGIAMTVPFGASAAAIMRTNIFPLWMAWLAIVVAVVAVLGAFTIVNTGGAVVPGGPVAIVLGVLTALWVLAASWFLIREHLPIPATGARPAMGH